MELFAMFTAWLNYASVMMAEAEVTEEKSEAHVRYLEAQAMVLAGMKAKVTVTRAQSLIDPDVMRAKDDVIVAYAQRKMTSVVKENCERCVFVVSRELSRRIGASPSERRVQRWKP